jgi:hypothetical protein
VAKFSCLRFETSLFVASYDLQGHGGGIRPRLHMGVVMGQSQSQGYIMTDGQSASLSLCQAPNWGLRPDFHCCQTVAGLLMWALSLTRGRICRLQLLLILGSTVILGSESRCYYLRFETPPTSRARSPYFYPPGTGWPSYTCTSRHWVPFSSPPTTRRTMVEVLEPAFTRGSLGFSPALHFIQPRHGPHKKHSLQQLYCCLFIRCHGW